MGRAGWLPSLTWVERKLLLRLSCVGVPNNCGLWEKDNFNVSANASVPVGTLKKNKKKTTTNGQAYKKTLQQNTKMVSSFKKKKSCSHPFHRTNCMGIDGGNSLHHTHLWPFSTRKTSALGELIWMLKVTLYLSLYFKSLDGTVTVSINCCHLWQEESYLPLSCQRSTFSVGVSRPWHAGIDGGQDTISAQTCLWSQCMPSLCWAFLLS